MLAFEQLNAAVNFEYAIGDYVSLGGQVDVRGYAKETRGVFCLELL